MNETTFSKVPEVTLGFWIIKSAPSTGTEPSHGTGHFVDDLIRKDLKLFAVEGNFLDLDVLGDVGAHLPNEFRRRQLKNIP
jgi:hypothetical protein